jgi:acyl-CoA reductase-like NAD-dependent aldehyde dehydrogenase
MAIDAITDRLTGKGENVEVHNPADGFVIDTLPVDGPERVREVVARVRANQPAWLSFPTSSVRRLTNSSWETLGNKGRARQR